MHVVLLLMLGLGFGAEAVGVLARLTPAQLVAALRDVGYVRAEMGKHQTEEGAEEEPRRTVGHGCHDVRLAASTAARADHFERTPLYADAAAAAAAAAATAAASGSGNLLDLTTMLETEEQAATKTEAATRAEADLAIDVDAPSPIKDLDCECEPYACSCHKQCFCRLAGDPFKGVHYPPDANCPVCAKCPNSGSDGSDVDEPAAPKQDFKCSCSFEGIGGAGISNGGYMECDCKVADCSCSKKCACKLKKSGDSSASFRESLPPTLATQEGATSATWDEDATTAGPHLADEASAVVPLAQEKKNRRTTTPLRANSILRTT